MPDFDNPEIIRQIIINALIFTAVVGLIVLICILVYRYKHRVEIYADSRDRYQEKQYKKLIDNAYTKGNADAQVELGDAVFTGDNPYKQQDYKKAFDLYLRAAKQNHPRGLYKVGYCYKYGIGTELDNKKAIEYFTKAHTLKETDGSYELGLYYVFDTLEYDKAFKIFESLEKNDKGRSLHMMGYCYQHGYGVTRSPSNAFRCYTESERAGYHDSRNLLAIAECYEKGIGVTMNPKEAGSYYRAAGKVSGNEEYIKKGDKLAPLPKPESKKTTTKTTTIPTPTKPAAPVRKRPSKKLYDKYAKELGLAVQAGVNDRLESISMVDYSCGAVLGNGIYFTFKYYIRSEYKTVGPRRFNEIIWEEINSNKRRIQEKSEYKEYDMDKEGKIEYDLSCKGTI